MILSLYFSTSILAQNLSHQDFADQLMKRYETMMEKMLLDMENFDRRHDDEYEKFMEKFLQRQFGGMQFSNTFYKWKESKDARELIFSGELVEDEKAKIEIKDKKIHLEGNFVQDFRGLKTKRFVKIKIPTPVDCDESKVKFSKTKKFLKMTFPKKEMKKIPIVKKDEVPVI